MSTIIPANPGFYVLEYLRTGDGSPITEYIVSPVVAWRLVEEGRYLHDGYRWETWPISVPYVDRHDALMLPTGEVEWTEARFDDVHAWLRGVNAFLERDSKRG